VQQLVVCTWCVRVRFVTGHQSERSEWYRRSVQLRTHANVTVTADVVRRRVLSGTRVHRSVSVLRQTRLRHARWKLRRAAAARQSTRARSDSSPAQTGSACHRVGLQQLRSGASIEDGDNWRSGCHQQYCRVTGTMPAGTLVTLLIFYCH